MKSSKGGFVVQAIVCLAVVAWQIYDLAVAPSAPSASMAIFDAVVLLCGVVGMIGAVYGLRKAVAT